MSSCLNLEDPQARLDCYDKSLSRRPRQKNYKSMVKNKEIELDEEDLFGKKGSDLEEVIAKTQNTNS